MSKPTVYSYVRFCSPEPAMGDSERRQLESAQAWAKRKGYTLDNSIGQDRGKSGFHGTHRKRGSLGRFLERVKGGDIPPGSILLVEKVTGLSREGAYKTLKNVVFELLERGIILQTISPELTFDQAAVDGPLLHVLVALLQSAYQESKDKSDYAASVWKRRRQLARADRKLMFRRLPAWVELKGSKLALIPERAAAVKRIFELAAAGYGHTRIVAALEREGRKPFGERKVNESRSRSQFAGVWTRAYVAKILGDRRSVGEMQPCGAGRKPEGPPVPDYFPAAIGEKEWLLARVGQDGRKNDHRPRQSKHLNLFVGLVTSAEDGDRFLLHNDGSAEDPRLSLVPAKALAGRGKWQAFSYPVFETAILKLLRELDPAELFPPAGREASHLDVLRAQLANTRREIASLKEDLARGYSAAVSDVLRRQEDREAELLEEIHQEQARAARPPAQDWGDLHDLAAALAEAPDPVDARLRLRAALQRRVREIMVWIIPRGRDKLMVAQVWFTDSDARRDYAIFNRPAVNRHRKGGWWARSLAEVTPDADALDLRDRATAKQLAEDLAAIELDSDR